MISRFLEQGGMFLERVHHYKIDGTLVAGMYFRFKVEQMDKYPDMELAGRMGYRPDLSAVALYEYEQGNRTNLIGAIVFYCNPETNGMHVWASYIFPKYRGKGLYPHLWDSLLEVAKRKEVLYIDSSTHRENETMRDLYEKQGRINMGDRKSVV